ncbi:MAG: nucleotide exchange factor GrpE [Bacilli bacterium]|nr:nucleotide exchange factor GrpE [Bacilli bacterium]
MEEKETCGCGNCNCENTEETCGCENEECNCAEEKEDKKIFGKNKKSNKLEKELEELKEVNKELENKLLVSKADFINYRKRKDEEISRLLKYSGEDMIKDMLSTVDNFERAIALDDENLDDELSKFLEGFKMIYCNFVNILEKYEIKAIDGNNKPFDPTYHQAVMTAHVEGMEPGMIIEVLQKGYLYKDRVIRPAMVKVSE